MMRDARTETTALAPLLSLIRDIIATLESPRLFDIEVFEPASCANRDEFILCCGNGGVALWNGAKLNMREDNLQEVSAVVRETSSPWAGYKRALYFRLKGKKAVCWFSTDSPQPLCNLPGDGVSLKNEQAILLLGMLMEEMMIEKANRQTISRHLFQALLITVEREVSRSRTLLQWSEDEMTVRRDDGGDSIDHARRYIESHLNQPLTIEGVARQVYMSRAQFAKRFRERTGQTFTDYVNGCRLCQAQKFLCETARPVSYITEMVGFQSDSYFHRLFRREVGVSPMEYRRQHQSGGGDGA